VASSLAGNAWLGAGVGYRHALRAALLASDAPSGIRVLEIMPDHFFRDLHHRPALDAAIAPLAERYQLVFHDVGLSLGTFDDGALFNARLQNIATVTQAARPMLFSDHLALTRSPNGLDAAHLVPLLLTEELLHHVTARISQTQDALGVPIAVENIAAPFALAGGDYDEPAFFHALVERTGCGMLLDVTNLLYTARNQQLNVHALLQAYPLHAVQQLHLAGGFEHAGYWVDSHSEPVEPATLDLLAALQPAAATLRTIVVERDSNIGDFAALSTEAVAAANRWQQACANGKQP
jgi:uncharacterized protein (UPF0276 family)